MAVSLRDGLARLGPRKARLAFTGVLTLVVAGVAGALVVLGVDNIEVVATLLVVPVVAVGLLVGREPGLAAGTVATGVYVVLRQPELGSTGAIGLGVLALSRVLAYAAAAYVGAEIGRYLDSLSPAPQRLEGTVVVETPDDPGWGLGAGAMVPAAAGIEGEGGWSGAGFGSDGGWSETSVDTRWYEDHDRGDGWSGAAPDAGQGYAAPDDGWSGAQAADDGTGGGWSAAPGANGGWPGAGEGDWAHDGYGHDGPRADAAGAWPVAPSEDPWADDQGYGVERQGSEGAWRDPGTGGYGALGADHGPWSADPWEEQPPADAGWASPAAAGGPLPPVSRLPAVDPETGLQSARYLCDRLALERGRAAGQGGSFSLVLVQVPDEPLAALSYRRQLALLRELGNLFVSGRLVDHLVHVPDRQQHWFAAVLPGVDHVGAQAVERRLRDGIARYLRRRGLALGLLDSASLTSPDDGPAIDALLETLIARGDPSAEHAVA